MLLLCLFVWSAFAERFCAFACLHGWVEPHFRWLLRSVIIGIVESFDKKFRAHVSIRNKTTLSCLNYVHVDTDYDQRTYVRAL